MDPTEVELRSLGRNGRQLPAVILAVVLLLIVAVVKPWSIGASAVPTASSSSHQAVAGASATSQSATATALDAAGNLCTSPDGWQIVANDVELGRSVRTWLVATAMYSAYPPLRSAIPVTSIVSSGVSSLGFCAPAALPGSAGTSWSGLLWRQGGDGTNSNAWHLAARLAPTPGSLGALADPLIQSVGGWPPGHYVLEASFEPFAPEAWLGLIIQSAH